MTTYTIPEELRIVRSHYCAGCGHGILHRLVAELVNELDITENLVAVAPIGCAVIAYDYWKFDVSEAAHGRAPAVATGIKRSLPDKVVFTYQGDGDLLAIGLSEIIHAANRGEKISVFFVNNNVYGMTGGQMAPTTLCGQKTLTTPYGRDKMDVGPPIDIIKMLSGLDNVKYLARGTVTNPKEVNKTKEYMRKSMQTQMDNKGFSMVEILSPCPTYWAMAPVNALKHINEEVVKIFPLGIFKDE